MMRRLGEVLMAVAAISMWTGWLIILAGASGCAVGSTVPAYTSAAAACVAQERFIIARGGYTYDQDRADLDSTRKVCDAILARIRQAGHQ